MRVLLVEDDPMIGEAIQAALRDASYAVDWVKNGQTASNILVTERYELLLLDLGLPGKDGLEVLHALRRDGHTLPVLILTARDGVDDRVAGLDQGADDYILKPFEMKELLARMRAAGRRQAGAATPVLVAGRLGLDPATRVAKVQGQDAVALTNREFALLQALMVRPGAILSRADLENRVYGWGEEVESNAIEYLIHALRKKLGKDSIKNVRGAGWMVSRAS